MIRHPEEQRIGERRVDIATSHRREQLRKDNRYKDRRSRSEQVPDKPARQDEEGASSRITPVPASPAAVEEVLANVALYPFDTSVVTRDLALRHAEELDRLRTRLSEAEGLLRASVSGNCTIMDVLRRDPSARLHRPMP